MLHHLLGHPDRAFSLHDIAHATGLGYGHRVLMRRSPHAPSRPRPPGRSLRREDLRPGRRRRPRSRKGRSEDPERPNARLPVRMRAWAGGAADRGRHRRRHPHLPEGTKAPPRGRVSTRSGWAPHRRRGSCPVPVDGLGGNPPWRGRSHPRRMWSRGGRESARLRPARPGNARGGRGRTRGGDGWKGRDLSTDGPCDRRHPDPVGGSTERRTKERHGGTDLPILRRAASVRGRPTFAGQRVHKF